MSTPLIFVNLSPGTMAQTIIVIHEDGSTAYYPGMLRGIIGDIIKIASNEHITNIKMHGIYDMVQPIMGELEERGFNVVCE